MGAKVVRTVNEKDLKRVDKLLRRKTPISLSELAERLGVTYPTAKRWFELWARDNEYLDGYVRQGARGPKARVLKAAEL